MSEIHWLPWSARAFVLARRERKPVLLSIVTAWSQACRIMDATSFADQDVHRIVSERFVPIRVDADRRPDIAERYGLGGWPTTAFLNPEGAIVGGGTFVERDRIAGVLRQAAEAFERRAGDIASAKPIAPELRMDGNAPAAESSLIRTAFDSFDEAYGGFGTSPKFPLVAPIRLALHLHRDDANERAAHIATVSLDAIGWGPLYDDADGGFFRCSAARDWSAPLQEKLLEVNASLIDLFVEAAQTLGSQRYADRAQDALRYLQNWLADPVDGGWAGSEAAAGHQEGAEQAGDRAAHGQADRVLTSSWNGQTVSAALRAAHAFTDDALGAFAVTSLERVLATCYRPGQGVAHCVDGATRIPGFLDDHVAMCAACLDAHEASGNIVYEMMAQELAKHAIRTMWDEDRRLFVDRPAAPTFESIGLMQYPLTPFAANCDAAIVLRRLAAVCGDTAFDTYAEAVLDVLAGAAAHQGPLAAHYVLARRASSVR
jgi:uncharacterized protein YyaL (SSP411 family)